MPPVFAPRDDGEWKRRVFLWKWQNKKVHKLLQNWAQEEGDVSDIDRLPTNRGSLLMFIPAGAALIYSQCRVLAWFKSHKVPSRGVSILIPAALWLEQISKPSFVWRTTPPAPPVEMNLGKDGKYWEWRLNQCYRRPWGDFEDELPGEQRELFC